jgi:hypothetical protein
VRCLVIDQSRVIFDLMGFGKEESEGKDKLRHVRLETELSSRGKRIPFSKIIDEMDEQKETKKRRRKRGEESTLTG